MNSSSAASDEQRSFFCRSEETNGPIKGSVCTFDVSLSSLFLLFLKTVMFHPEFS